MDLPRPHPRSLSPHAQALGGMGLVAGLALFGAVNVIATLLFVPAWLFPLVAGAVFGMGWGRKVRL